MVQIKKDNIRQHILLTAKEEFLKKGFKDSSMRVIAKKANVSPSNIYNYFKNKDEILQEVLTPLLNALNNIMNIHSSSKFLDLNIFTSEEYQRIHMNLYLDLISDYKSELKLILLNVHGSSFENFKENYASTCVKDGIEYMKKLKEKYPNININVSDYFIHTSSLWWINLIEFIVTHELNQTELESFLADQFAFSTAGWKRLMNI